MRTERSVRLIGTTSLVLLAAVLVYVPTLEAWTSVANGGISLSLILIGVIPMIVAVAVIGTAGYLWTRQADVRHVRAAAGWAWGAVAFSWIMHEYVAIAQTIGGGTVDHRVNMTTTVATWAVIGLAVGLARSFRTEQQEQISAERDRFSSLFENTSDAVLEVTAEPVDPGYLHSVDPDPVSDGGSATGSAASGSTTSRDDAGSRDDSGDAENGAEGSTTGGGHPEESVGITGGGLEVIAANSTFELAFERDADTVLAEAVASEESDYSYETLRERVAAGERYGAEIRVRSPSTEDRDRYFMLRTVSAAGDRSFLTLTDITDQKERQRLLRERERELEREKSAREAELEERTTQLEFLHSLLRHDVQNGMMVVNSRAEFLADRTEDDLASYANTIVSRSDDIASKIDRMQAAIAAITEDGVDKRKVDLSSVLSDRGAAIAMSEPDVEIETEIDEGLGIRANDLVDDVFENVLRNAVAHNDAEKPKLRIQATQTDETVRVVIADNGPGIPPEERDEVFRRGVTSASTGAGGSGFGLFFVDTMVDAYDGVVSVEDSDMGGAAFVFEFPAAA